MLGENPPLEITVRNLKWLETADADEIVERFISVVQQANPCDMQRLVNAFFNRAKSDPRIMAAYDAFSSEESAAAHACVHYNFKTELGRWTQDIGQRAFEENYAKELAKLMPVIDPTVWVKRIKPLEQMIHESGILDKETKR